MPKCYLLIGLINSNNKVSLYLYGYISNSFESGFYDKLDINSDSENIICNKLNSFYDHEELICFYENYNSNEIVASNININLNNAKIEIISSKSQTNNGGKIIKSILSKDKSKCYVCYINKDNNSNCLIYDVNNNKWINNNNIYLNDCLPNFSSLNIDLIDNSNELLLYCYQSSNKLNLVRLNNNLEIINEEQKGSYDIDDNTFDNCNKYYIYSLTVDTDNTIKILGNCDNNILKYEIQKSPNELITTIILYTTIPNSPTTNLSYIISTTIINFDNDYKSDYEIDYKSDYENHY